MSGHFKRATRSDSHQLAAAMFERDDAIEGAPISLNGYRAAVQDVLEYAANAGWKIEVPRGWKNRNH